MLRLHKLFQNGCVLQQGSQCRIWGWSDPLEEVRLSVEALQEPDQEKNKMGSVCCRAQVTADANGLFALTLETPSAGGPYRMRVKNSGGDEAVLDEVYVGEVFVCAGQSNMELPMSRVRERFPEEFQNGGAPDVHEYKVTEHYDFDGPLEDHVQAEWRACAGEKLPEVSAFAYFFGKALVKAKKTPVGILNLSLGGSPAEAWMSREGLHEWPEAIECAERYRDGDFCRDLAEREAREEENWQREIVRMEEKSISAPWRAATLPGQLKDWGLEDFCGCIYLRRTFEAPEDCLQCDGLLRFGTLVDSDTIYINGTCVGETTYRYPPRRYRVPAGLLHEGENEILIRLVCRTGEGRSTAGQPTEIVWEDETKGMRRVSLAGAWEYQVRAVCKTAPAQTFVSWMPTGLFHGMAAPCLPYRVRGVIWYQGESNDSRPQTYAAVLRDLIRDWRSCWQQERLPFVVIQLPNCGVDVAPDDAWPQVREAQRLAGELQDVAVTVNLDVGEDNDLHPRDKKTVAERAACAVRAMIYKEDIAWKAPEVCGWEIQKTRGAKGMQGQGSGACCVRLRFDGRVALRLRPEAQDAPDNPHLFELASGDGVYRPASARVEGEYVLLQAEGTTDPEYVRYAWSRAPGATLLYGENGFCVGPFRLCLKKQLP